MRLVKAAKAFPHAKFYNLSTVYSYTNMRSFKNSVLMSKKETYPADSVFQFVSFGPSNWKILAGLKNLSLARLKNLSAAVNATKNVTKILLWGVNQELFFFFAQKLSDLGPVLNKLMQLKRVTDENSH